MSVVLHGYLLPIIQASVNGGNGGAFKIIIIGYLSPAAYETVVTFGHKK